MAMKILNRSHTMTLWGLSLVAIVFGVMTLKSAYLVLFTTGTFHQGAGHYVPFVVIFNGSAAFLYLIAGMGLFRQKRWAVRLSFLIASATVVVYGLFGLHVYSGGTYEMQTVVAMAIRSGVWSIIAVTSWFLLSGIRHPAKG